MFNENESTKINICLPSNSSVGNYPANKPQHFTTELAKPLLLSGKWQVALRAFSYPNNYFNLRESCWLSVTFHPNAAILHDETDEWVAELGKSTIGTTIEAGRYENIYSIIKEIESGIKESANNPFPIVGDFVDLKRPIKCDYNINNKKLTISAKNNYTEVTFNNDELYHLLGFERNNFFLPQTSTKEISLKTQLPGCYIYTDIVEATRIGDTFGKLIQYVPFDSTQETAYKEYINPTYYELESNEIQTIEIKILDSSGRLIIFPTGQTNLQLEFKRCDVV